MEFDRPFEIPPPQNSPETTGPPADLPFQPAEPEPTFLTPASEQSALDHEVPPDFILFNAAELLRPVYEARDADAAQVCADKPRLSNNWNFIGPDAVEVYEYGHAKTIDEFISEQRSVIPEGQRPPTEQERAALAIADAGIKDIAAKANVVLQPITTPVYYFDYPKDYDRAAVARGYQSNESVAGCADSLRGLLWNTAIISDPAGNESGQVHERVHQHTKTVALPAIRGHNPDGSLVISSNITTAVDSLIGGHSYFEEAITDMAEIRIMRGIGRPWSSSYTAMNILLEQGIEETARKLGISENLIEFSLYRSMLGGDREGIDMMREALGTERSTQLFRLKLTDLTDLAEVAQQLRMPGAVPVMERFMQKGQVYLFPWQPQN